MAIEIINVQKPMPHHPPLVLCLGYFDGLHRGHQELVKRAIHIAAQKKAQAALLTFDPSPSVVIGKTGDDHFLTSIEDRHQILLDLGVSLLLVLPFNRNLATLSPQAFVDAILRPMTIDTLVVGFDFRYGYQGQGSAHTLGSDSHYQFQVEIVDEIDSDGQKISSSQILRSIKEGQVDLARLWLGRPYGFVGRVQKGYGNGQKIGYPTANISLLDKRYIIPAQGVYAVRVQLKNRWYGGMANIGYHPTISPLSDKQLEVHLFNFSGDLYDQVLRIEFIQWIRPEQKFASLKDLINQLQMDEEIVKRRLWLEAELLK